MGKGEKINLLDLQKKGINCGELDLREINDFVEKITVLKFTRNENDLMPMSKFENKNVCPAHIQDAKEGYSIVKLTPSGKSYDAEIIMHLDASFLVGLLKEERDIITSALWEEHQSEVLTYMEDIGNVKIAELVEKKAAEDLEDIRNEKLELEETVNELKKDNEQMKQQLQEKVEMIELLRNSKTSEKEPEIPFESAVKDLYSITRISEDVLQSPWFIAPKYFVHVSRDMKTMIIRPHDYGTVFSSKMMIQLPGLSTLSPFTEPCEMNTEFNPKDNSLTVHL